MQPGRRCTKTRTRRVFLLFTTVVFVRGMHVFCVAHGVGVLFALNIYGNAQAGALLILHIARLV